MEIDWILWMTDRGEGGLLKGTTVVLVDYRYFCREAVEWL